MGIKVDQIINYGRVYYQEEPFPGEDVARVQCSRELHRQNPGMLFQCTGFEANAYLTQHGEAVWVKAKFQRVR